MPEQIKQDLTVPSINGTLCAMNKRIIPNAGTFIADFFIWKYKIQRKELKNYKVLCFIVKFIHFRMIFLISLVKESLELGYFN